MQPTFRSSERPSKHACRIRIFNPPQTACERRIPTDSGTMPSIRTHPAILRIDSRHCARAPVALGAFLVVLAAATIATTIEAATRTSASLQRIRHPTEENIPSRTELAAYVDQKSSMAEDRILQEAVQWLSGTEEVFRIGVRDGELHEMFGSIKDVAVNGEGDIFVLDYQHKQVFMFGSDGSYIQSIGQAGAGPGEFEFPEAIVTDDHDRLIVADAKLRISVFALHEGTNALESAIMLAFSPKDMCIANGQLFLAGAWLDQGNRYVHSFTTDGQYVRSLGELYKSDVPLLGQGLSYGPLACGKDGEGLVYMFGWLPVIHSYSQSGESRWISMLGDFDPTGVFSYGASEVRYEGDGSAFDVVENVVAASAELVLVQVKRITQESMEAQLPYARLSTYVFSLESGNGIYVGDKFPPIYAVRANRLFAASASPFPQVLVFEAESVSGPN